jgi:hypothetical protein
MISLQGLGISASLLDHPDMSQNGLGREPESVLINFGRSGRRSEKVLNFTRQPMMLLGYSGYL